MPVALLMKPAIHWCAAHNISGLWIEYLAVQAAISSTHKKHLPRGVSHRIGGTIVLLTTIERPIRKHVQSRPALCVIRGNCNAGAAAHMHMPAVFLKPVLHIFTNGLCGAPRLRLGSAGDKRRELTATAPTEAEKAAYPPKILLATDAHERAVTSLFPPAAAAVARMA